MAPLERIYIEGNLFEAAISPSRSVSEILPFDSRKYGKGLFFLRRVDVEELGQVVDQVERGEPVLISSPRFQVILSIRRTHADIVDRRNPGILASLDRAALEELRQMTEEVLGVLVE